MMPADVSSTVSLSFTYLFQFRVVGCYRGQEFADSKTVWVALETLFDFFRHAGTVLHVVEHVVDGGLCMCTDPNVGVSGTAVLNISSVLCACCSRV